MTARIPQHGAGLPEAFRGFVSASHEEPDSVAGYFLPGEQTLLVANGTMVVGYPAIAEALRAGFLPAVGRPAQTHMRELGTDATLISATYRRPDGTRGAMSLLWERAQRQDIAGQWRLASAHLSDLAPGIDPRIWRTVGTPLAGPSGSGDLDGTTVAVAATVESSALPDALAAAGASLAGVATVDASGEMTGTCRAVAHAQADIGLGIDTDGTLRVPAARHGLYAMRTTHGLLSLDGVDPQAPAMDAIGWATRDVDLLARVADVLMPDQGHRKVGELLVCTELIGMADADVARAIERVTDSWESSWLGVRTVHHEPARLQEWADVMAATTGEETWQTRRDQAAARAAIAEFLGGGVLVLPTLASCTVPSQPPVADDGRTATLQALATLGGLPSVTVPLATRRGKVCGVSLLGPVSADHAVVRLAQRLAGLVRPPH